uniref:Uncharacterized protein n=1 Tax=Oryza punctata TaxID=4537 RepID=A0A0E0M4F2_ORYPU
MAGLLSETTMTKISTREHSLSIRQRWSKVHDSLSSSRHFTNPFFDEKNPSLNLSYGIWRLRRERKFLADIRMTLDLISNSVREMDDHFTRRFEQLV